VRAASILDVAAEDIPALDLLTAVISDRLGRDLRETRGLAYSVGAALAAHGEGSVFNAWISPRRENLAAAEEALTAALRDFDPATVTAAELDRIRSSRTGRLMMRRLSSIGQAYHLTMAELDGDFASYGATFDRYEAVTLADVRRVGARYLTGMPLVVVVVD